MNYTIEEKHKDLNYYLSEEHRIIATTQDYLCMNFREENSVTFKVSDNCEISCGDFCIIDVKCNNKISCGDCCTLDVGENNSIECDLFCTIVGQTMNNIVCGNNCNIVVQENNCIVCGTNCMISVYDVSAQDIVWNYNCVILDRASGKVYHNTVGSEKFNP